MSVLFQNLEENIHENKSKLLDPKSSLYILLRHTRNHLSETFKNFKMASQRMNFHIELTSVKSGPSLERANILQDRKFQVDVQNVGWMDPAPAIAIKTDLSRFNFVDEVEKTREDGSKYTENVPKTEAHITIAYFEDPQLTQEVKDAMTRSAKTFIESLF